MRLQEIWNKYGRSTPWAGSATTRAVLVRNLVEFVMLVIGLTVLTFIAAELVFFLFQHARHVQ
jgi:hypothetical protein